jgi:hypothetical protein
MRMIMDNYGTHKHKKVRRFLDRHRRFKVSLHPYQFELAQFGGTLVCRTRLFDD